jgi:hypothetical protein
MKTTQIERQWLNDYLYEVMEYKETFEEVYDHMLLSLENEPEEQNLNIAIQNIVNRDFGGAKGLSLLEQQCYDTAKENAQIQLWYNFKQWFTSPMVVVTLLLFATLFQLHHIKGALLWMALFFCILFFAPAVKLTLRWLGLNDKHSDSKASIKDEVSRDVAFKSYFLIWKIFIISNICIVIGQYLLNIQPTVNKTTERPTELGFTILISISSAVFLLMIIYLVSMAKLYRSEFKTQMIN